MSININKGNPYQNQPNNSFLILAKKYGAKQNTKAIEIKDLLYKQKSNSLQKNTTIKAYIIQPKN